MFIYIILSEIVKSIDDIIIKGGTEYKNSEV